ncbi:MAG: hypothetical protein IRZ21_03545 [Thermoleophilaceae bacterium]|nr:hypothetical protein [Thermoleophilaceae bacterium]
MRSIAAVLAVSALALTAAPAAASGGAGDLQSDGPRALIAFLPTRPAPRQPLLGELAHRPGLAIGLTSPTLGGFSPAQMALDISQGTRISTRAYGERLGPLAFSRRGAGGLVAGWGDAVRRADDAPGELVPGLLATTVERAGGRVGYVGPDGADQLEAIVAADERGRVEEASLGPAGTVAARAVRMWRRATLTVVRLPGDAAGLRALDALLAARRPGDLLYVVRAAPAGLRLLPTGIAGPGFRGGVLRSATTRRDGLVTATDVAPTVLRFLGLSAPSEMEGQPIESRPSPSGPAAARDLQRLSARLDVVMTRRLGVFRVALLSWLAVLALLGAARRARGLRQGLRIAFLSALWLPVLALLAAALRPGRTAESLLVALGALALGALTDRLVRWPVAPALPAAVSLAAHAADLAGGSSLIALALTGSNPKGGARFYGIGNELEIILSVTTLIGAGAALTTVAPRLVPRGFALAALAAAVFIGAGRLGADVGGVITLGAGAAVAVLASLPGGVTRRAAAVAVAVPVLAVGALILLDVVSGGGAHLTRSVVDAGSPGDVVDIVVRRLRLSTAGIGKGTIPISIGVSIALLVAGVAWRRPLLAPLDAAADGGRSFRAGLAGALAATVVGALANDSGPVILFIGTVSLVLAVAYVHGALAAAVGRGRRARV